MLSNCFNCRRQKRSKPLPYFFKFILNPIVSHKSQFRNLRCTFASDLSIGSSGGPNQRHVPAAQIFKRYHRRIRQLFFQIGFEVSLKLFPSIAVDLIQNRQETDEPLSGPDLKLFQPR